MKDHKQAQVMNEPLCVSGAMLVCPTYLFILLKSFYAIAQMQLKELTIFNEKRDGEPEVAHNVFFLTLKHHLLLSIYFD